MCYKYIYNTVIKGDTSAAHLFSANKNRFDITFVRYYNSVMKKLTFTLIIMTAVIVRTLFFPRTDGNCTGSKCCEKCRTVYSACIEKYEQQLFSGCHASCGSSHPGDKEGYSACLDGCYLDVEKHITEEGYPPCDGSFASCSEKCGGCAE